MTRTPGARRLAAFLAGSGLAHFLVPAFYDGMIPPVLPGPARAWVTGSGVVEVAVGAAVALPRTRRVGGLAAAALFVAVLPANVYMLLEAQKKSQPAPVRAVLTARLPLQLPLIAWAVRVRRAAG
ncbi:MAG: hypothetical protein M3O28_12490 [Actinomycetota bacterium]|nr:hypothetical protein [Actinomycetota bacterium]